MKFFPVLAALGIAALFTGAMPSAIAAPAPKEYTISLDTPDLHYGDYATFSYSLARRYHNMTSAVVCWQGPFVSWWDANMILERGLDPRLYSGTLTFLIANGQGGLNNGLVPLDYSQPASCVAYIFQEPHGANSSGQILTNVLAFDVLP